MAAAGKKNIGVAQGTTEPTVMTNLLRKILANDDSKKSEVDLSRPGPTEGLLRAKRDERNQTRD